MKPAAICLLIFSVLFFTCTPDKVTIDVVRNPSISFDLDSASSWKAKNTSFAPLTKVLVYPADTSKPALLYNRYTMTSTGTTTTGQNLQLMISFDVVDANKLIGVYNTSYSLAKGLADVQIYNLTDNNNLMVYNLCTTNGTQALFQIQRQDQAERLITGTFQMTLCNSRDSLQKLKIINGTFTDTRY